MDTRSHHRKTRVVVVKRISLSAESRQTPSQGGLTSPSTDSLTPSMASRHGSSHSRKSVEHHHHHRHLGEYCTSDLPRGRPEIPHTNESDEEDDKDQAEKKSKSAFRRILARL
ncbi:hypothetical protein BGZ93_001766 [Podila epicladia]|nr:hypothetical protein BGZ92_001865 [Podila epicladia]KAG0097869.1 hypothetical protein BGZ93_001766 [Podila epicladia]